MCGALRANPDGPVQKVVAVGGYKDGYDYGDSSLSTVEIYDVKRNIWTKGQLMRIDRDDS